MVILRFEVFALRETFLTVCHHLSAVTEMDLIGENEIRDYPVSFYIISEFCEKSTLRCWF